MHRTLMAALLMTASGVAHAEGQPPARVSVSFGAGATLVIAIDDSDVKPIYAGSIRYDDVRPHLAVEGAQRLCLWTRNHEHGRGRAGRASLIDANPVSHLAGR